MSARSEEADARELVYLRDGGVCVKCHRVDPIFGVNWDHRKNRSQGGKWAASNGQTLCGSGTTGCHGFVTSHPREAVAEGWAVPGWPLADPREWPARRWVSDAGVLRLRWVIYLDQEDYHHRLFVVIPEKEARERMKQMGWSE